MKYYLGLDNGGSNTKAAIFEFRKKTIDIAIELCMYTMKAQVFIDGNKRISVIYANHYLIAHG